MLSSPKWAERKSKMLKNTRDYNAAECMVWMYANNQGKIDIYMPNDFPRYLISLVPINQLKFPEGWYYSKDTKTVNNDLNTVFYSIEVKE